MVNPAFLNAIIDAHDDDAPRLVYADWLDEHNQPERAELIRLQCELARKERYDPTRLPLEKREQELLKKHGAKWAEPLAPITRDYEYRRGFVDSVAIGVRKFLTHGAKLFQLAPVRNVKLTRLSSSSVKASDLAKSGLLRWIRGLTLQGERYLDQLSSILALPELKHLQSLTLEKCFQPASIKPILAGRLSQLETLNLDVEESVLTTEHVEKLAKARWLSALRALNLNGHAINVGGVQALAKSKHLTGLTSLTLKGCGAGLAGTQAIAESSTLSNLSTLDLRRNRLTDRAIQTLASSTNLPSLRELYLGMNEIGPEGARALANWPGLSRLSLLHLYACRIGDEGVCALAASPHIANLWCLDVTETDIGERGTQALAESPYLKNVRVGSFRGN